MTNNDILRRIRYIFEFKDPEMIEIFGLADLQVTRAEVCDWLKKEEDPGYKECNDTQLAIFLNGFIIFKRGKKEGLTPIPEDRINNNIIFRKIKIALDLKAEEVLKMLSLGGLEISKHELSALFRRPDHKHYRTCNDQILRNFLNGVQLTYHPGEEE